VIGLLTDASLNGDIIDAARRMLPSIDLVTAQDVGLRQAPDPDVLDWAARNGRVVVASDSETMIGFARARVAAGLPMPGLVHSKQRLGVGLVARDLVLIAECLAPGEWDGRVVYLPL
jgi:hypothetical protein